MKSKPNNSGKLNNYLEFLTSYHTTNIYEDIFEIEDEQNEKLFVTGAHISRLGIIFSVVSVSMI